MFWRLNVLQQKSSRSKYTPGNVNWTSTPVPGVRILPEYDLYRQDVLDEKNPLYQTDAGLLPKYMGYVPGESRGTKD